MRSYLLAAVLLSLAVPVFAENLQQAPSSIEEVEVLGTRQAKDTAIDVDLKSYNGFENIISRAEFENRLVDIGDVINQSISAQIRKNSGFGGYSAFSIRGSTGKQVNLYLDGMLLTSPDTGYSSLAVIPTSIIEQIQVFPDFTPVELSDANLGGAINIKTRTPEQGFGGRVALSYGSFNTQGEGVDFWGGSDKTHAIIALSHNQSDNDYPIDKSVICDSMTCGSSRRRENAGYSNYSALAKLRHDFDDSYTLHVLLGSSKSRNGVPAPNNRLSQKADLSNQLNQFSSLFEADLDALRYGVRLYANSQGQNFYDDGAMIPGGADIKQSQTQWGISSFIRYQSAINNVGVNLDVSQSQNTTRDKNQSDKLKSQRKRLLLALSDTIYATPSWSFTGLVRANLIDDSSQNKLSGMKGSRCDGGDKACTENKQWYPSYQLSSAYEQGFWQVKLNIGKMVRVPTLHERFGEAGAFLGNANLKPEKSHNVDMGFIFDNQHSFVQFTLFYKQLKDGIFTSFDARGVGHPDNTDKAVIYGSELLFKQKFAEYFTFYVGGQWMDSENQSLVKASKGKKLAGIYHTSSQIGLQFQSSQHQADVHYQWDDELYYNAANSRKAKARKLLNASYSYFIGAFTLNLSANNLLDYRYVDFDFMPAQGRSFTTTLSYNF